MSVRVVARLRPLLNSELEKDQIVTIHNVHEQHESKSIVKVPNPKNETEEYSFQFNSVYGSDATQQEIYDTEVAPTVKHLFQGFDVTIFAYGSTGTGKTHTMRGGKSLVDRGMIPRLLSGIYRKSRSVEKANAQATVEVTMSYYEIYNDKVFDLFEAPEKRTPTGLPIREAEGGKTVVVGLGEVPCASLKEFEVLYDKANGNRSTGATKLNAHSSRSHAILCVKVTISTPAETRISTASAIDLAGSEDNRRTGNGKDRMVESASINKSLFVLAQCVEAISKKQCRIPYRESKMTRILSLGQNNGLTVMILNLAPTKSYHLDTLSSLNFANRTKKIEVREVENEPIFKGPPRQTNTTALGINGAPAQRKPLQPLANGVNLNLVPQEDQKIDKPVKAFAVFSDKTRPMQQTTRPITMQKSSPLKRAADASFLTSARPSKTSRPTPQSSSFIRRIPESTTTTITKASIESLVEKKVTEILAQRALNAPDPMPTRDISSEVQQRLDSIEKRLECQKDDERAEGLSYLLMAKQHQARGEDGSALRMYRLAHPYFPDNQKLIKKIEQLEQKQRQKRLERDDEAVEHTHERSNTKSNRKSASQRPVSTNHENENDESYHDFNDNHLDSEDDSDYPSDTSNHHKPHSRKPHTKSKPTRHHKSSLSTTHETTPPTPRTTKLLAIINSRDPSQIKSLSGLGAKRAEGVIECLNEMDRALFGENNRYDGIDDEAQSSKNTLITRKTELVSWKDLASLKGIGKKTLESMRQGLVV